MTKKLYSHKTDGGAEYLCTSPLPGTDEGDLHTAVIRLDGGAEFIRDPSAQVEEMQKQKAALLKALRRIAETDFDGTEATRFQEWAQGLALDTLADIEGE